MPGDPRLRASDADRERVASVLREHAAVGRLTTEEFQERLDKVYTARTVGELDALLADLPGIDLYKLPSAGIYQYQPGGVGNMERRADGSLVPYRAPERLVLYLVTTALLVVWLSVGAVVGGAAWIPWFLLIVIPWALFIARRPRRPLSRNRPPSLHTR